MDKGTVQVQIAFDRDDLRQAGIPVEVRQLSMVVAERGSTGRPITVDPGTYLVTATLPGGEELLQRVEVGAGETKTVDLTPPGVGEVSAPPSSPRYATQQYFAGTTPPTTRRAPMRAEKSPAEASAEAGPQPATLSADDRDILDQPSGGGPLPRSAGPTAPSERFTDRAVFLRLLHGNPFAQPLRTIGGLRILFSSASGAAGQGDPIGEPLDKLPLLSNGTGLPGSDGATERWISPDTYQLVLTMPPDDARNQAFWLRITSPPDRARFVAVPALPGDQCVLLLTRSGTQLAIAVDFHLADPAIDSLLHYYQHGDAPELGAMLLRDEIKQRAAESPLYWALVSYIALRLGGAALEGLIKPGLDLGDRDKFPDARVIDGEFLARQGRHEEAQALFARCTEDGLPIFSDGLGYLSSRIPQYLRLMSVKEAPLSRAWDRLRTFLRTADLKPVVLTLRADVLHYKDR